MVAQTRRLGYRVLEVARFVASSLAADKLWQWAWLWGGVVSDPHSLTLLS